jgi:ribonuclease-3
VILARLLRLKRSKTQNSIYLFVKNSTGSAPRDLSIYISAFTHSSAEKADDSGRKINYERLEFLGDAILNYVIAEYLFKALPFNDEGTLTLMRSKIVRRVFLNRVGKEIGLVKYLNSKVEEKNYSPNIHGNLLEAFVGAVYLDSGFKSCSGFIYSAIILPHVDLKKLRLQVLSYKSLLVNWFQKTKKTHLFDVVLEKEGENINSFKATLLVDGKRIASAFGTNKKTAVELASKHAYNKLQGKIKKVLKKQQERVEGH